MREVLVAVRRFLVETLAVWTEGLSGAVAVLSRPVGTLRLIAGAPGTLAEASRLLLALFDDAASVAVASPPGQPVLHTRLERLGRVTTLVVHDAEVPPEVLEEHRKRVWRLLRPLHDLTDLSARVQGTVAVLLPLGVVVQQTLSLVSSGTGWPGLAQVVLLGAGGSLLLSVIVRLLHRAGLRWAWRRLERTLGAPRAETQLAIGD